MNRTIAYFALAEIAKRNNVPLDTVLNEINTAISMAMQDPDPSVQAFWRTVPSTGETPTPMDAIAYIASMVQLDPLTSTPQSTAL